MRRRAFIAALGGVAAWPLAARAALPDHVPRIGYLSLGPASAYVGRVEALRGGLRDLGYVEGKNIEIIFRWAASANQLKDLAAELVRMKVDLIVANSSIQVEAALQVSNKIPIVFCVHGDPVGAGHAASLSHPGGNVTGLSILQTDIAVKQLEILTQAVASARRIGVLWNPAVPSHLPALTAIKTAGKKLGIELVDVPARTANDLADAFSTVSQAGATAVFVVTSPFVASQRELVAELALRYRLPAMLGTKAEVEAGALMSYGADIDDQFRRAAAYIDKIIKGDKPGDLPIEQASRYQLVINLKTAKALGITIPPELLGRADDVIE